MLTFNSLHAEEALYAVRTLLNQRLATRQIATGSTIVLTDYAPNLRTVGELLLMMDREAQKADRSITIDLILLALGGNTPAGVEDLPPDLKETGTKLLQTLAVKTIALPGRSQARVTPSQRPVSKPSPATPGGSAPLPPTVSLEPMAERVAVNIVGVDFESVAELRAYPEGDQIRIDEFRNNRPFYQANRLVLPQGQFQVLTTQGNPTKGYLVLVARGTIEQ
jgi:hypothetical protein